MDLSQAERARERLRFEEAFGLQVVLADDDALALGAMSSLLASWGCTVTAADTADALLVVTTVGCNAPSLRIRRSAPTSTRRPATVALTPSTV